MNATGGMPTGGMPSGGGMGPPGGGGRRPSFTQAQLKALHNIPRITGALSVLGSCVVLYMILKSSMHRFGRIQNRLLCAISIADIPFSLMFVLGTILMPDFLPIDGTYGNVSTCEFQGFMLQSGYAQPIYNAILMVYYAVTVCGGERDAFIAKWIEPWCHAFAILFAIGTASAGVALNIYNPSPTGRCSINSFPMGCVENPNVPCQRGADHRKYKWAFNLGPTLVALVVIFGALAVLTFYVMNHERNALQKSRHRTAHHLRKAVTIRPALGNQVVTRALLYSFIFLNTYSWITIANLIRVIAHSPPPYWLVLTGNILQPSQGFFNWLLYFQPRYSHIRKSFKDWSWWRVSYYAIHHGTMNLPKNRRLSSGGTSQSVWNEVVDQSVTRRLSSAFRTESSNLAEGAGVAVVFSGVPDEESRLETGGTEASSDGVEGAFNPESLSDGGDDSPAETA